MHSWYDESSAKHSHHQLLCNNNSFGIYPDIVDALADFHIIEEWIIGLGASTLLVNFSGLETWHHLCYYNLD